MKKDLALTIKLLVFIMCVTIAVTTLSLILETLMERIGG
jgi:hypothetical protein